MSEKEIRELARQSMLETIKTNLHSGMIFTYIKSLEDRIDKAIEYIEEYTKDTNFVNGYELLDILRGENDGGL